MPDYPPIAAGDYIIHPFNTNPSDSGCLMLDSDCEVAAGALGKRYVKKPYTHIHHGPNGCYTIKDTDVVLYNPLPTGEPKSSTAKICKANPTVLNPPALPPLMVQPPGTQPPGKDDKKEDEKKEDTTPANNKEDEDQTKIIVGIAIAFVVLMIVMK